MWIDIVLLEQWSVSSEVCHQLETNICILS